MSTTENQEWALQEVRERRFLIDRCDAWIYDEISPYLGRRVLEVGCGMGNLILHLQDRELVVGIDPDEKSVQHLEQAYQAQPHVQAYALDICEPAVLDLPGRPFDTIVSLNVFEHIADDVLALRHARRLLQPGGRLVLIVPAHNWLYGAMDRSIGHYRRYDRRSMGEKLAQAGFRPLKQKYMNALGTLGWLVNGRILRKQVPPSGQLRLFNRLVPLVQAMEKIIPMPLGLSLLSVAE